MIEEIVSKAVGKEIDQVMGLMPGMMKMQGGG